MTTQELRLLKSYSRAAKLSSLHRSGLKPSKRSVRNNGRGVGQVLKRSQVRADCHIETVFSKRP